MSGLIPPGVTTTSCHLIVIVLLLPAHPCRMFDRISDAHFGRYAFSLSPSLFSFPVFPPFLSLSPFLLASRFARLVSSFPFFLPAPLFCLSFLLSFFLWFSSPVPSLFGLRLLAVVLRFLLSITLWVSAHLPLIFFPSSFSFSPLPIAPRLRRLFARLGFLHNSSFACTLACAPCSVLWCVHSSWLFLLRFAACSACYTC